MSRTPTERTIAAEARAVEEGHQARVAGDGRHFLVRSDTHDGLDYNVGIYAAGEIVVFTCDHNCYDEHGQRVPGRVPARTFVPCKHGARGARRLEREGMLRWDGWTWSPTAKAVTAGMAAPATEDPFDGLPA